MGTLQKSQNVTKNRSAPGNCWKSVIFTFWTAPITSTEQLVAKPEKSWFLMRKSSRSMKITKTEQLFRSFTSWWSSKSCPESWFFGKSSIGNLQKSQKCHGKIDTHLVIPEKTVIFTFWTASHTCTWQLVVGAEKSLFLMKKSSGSLKITKTKQLSRSFTSCWSSKSYSESWFFGKSSMLTLQKSQKCHEK